MPALVVFLDIFVAVLVAVRLRYLVRTIGWRGIVRELGRR